MDALERLANNGSDTQQVWTFRCPVARRAAAVLLSGEYDERYVLPLVTHGRVVDRHALARGMVHRDTSFDPRHHLILQPDIGKGAAHHHFVVAAPRAVLV